MGRIVGNFFIVWVLVTVAVIAWRHLSNRDKWTTARSVTFGAITAAVATALLTIVVILF